jgi:hypothetical protein
MHEIWGFVKWQVRRLGRDGMLFMIAMSMMITGTFMDTDSAPRIMGWPLDMVLLTGSIVLWFCWLAMLMLRQQYQHYLHEKNQIIESLTRKKL